MKNKIKPIKAWAVVCKEMNNFPAEAFPNWGRYWIFQKRKEAQKEIKDRFYNSRNNYMEKAIPVLITPLSITKKNK